VGLVAPDDTAGITTEPSPAVPSPAVPSPVVPSEATPPELVEPVELDREDRLPVPVIGYSVVGLFGAVAFPGVDEEAVVAEVAMVDGAEPQASEPDVPDIVADPLGVPGIVDA
jgi:hypothetical protein